MNIHIEPTKEFPDSQYLIAYRNKRQFKVNKNNSLMQLSNLADLQNLKKKLI